MRKELLKGLTEEQIKKVEACKSSEEIIELAKAEGIELTDEQLNSCIGDAIAVYSKYAYFPEKYLCVNLKKYKHGCGIDLHEFHIMSVKDIAF